YRVSEAAVPQRNGLSLCVDSPVKSTAKRPLRRVLESDSDEEEAVLTAQAEVSPIQDKSSEKASSKQVSSAHSQSLPLNPHGALHLACTSSMPPPCLALVPFTPVRFWAPSCMCPLMVVLQCNGTCLIHVIMVPVATCAGLPSLGVLVQANCWETPRNTSAVGPVYLAWWLPISLWLCDPSSFSKPAVPLDPVEYNPSKSSYHPVQDACWGHGQRVPYLAVARTFERIEEVSARLKNIETLSNLFRSVIALSPSDILPCIYLCLNRLGPAYKGLELGIGETILMKAVAQATGRQLDQIKAEAQEKGDLGLVAESSRSNQRTMFTPPKLSAAGVFSKLQEIARMTGSASMNKKIDIIKGLFVACRHSEARYITRSLGGKLRIGLAEQSVLSAIAHAVSLTPPGQGFPPEVLDAGQGKSAETRKAWLEEQTQILKQTFCELPSYDIIVPILLEHGVESLPQHCKITPGIPLKPMLAQPTKGIGEVLKRFEEAAFTCEYKYDGERAQIHILENGDVHIYSRNQEDNTSKYPDIISRIPKVKKGSVRSCILDAEAVAWDPEKRQIQPFQVLTTRKRKDVEAAEIKVQVCLYAFDILYLNGESLVKEPFSRRRQLLHESFVETEGELMFATSMDTCSLDEISEFLDQSIKDSCEGLMVKTLEVDATYEIAKRSHKWLKLKKDYLEGVGDTLDLVVIGAYLGKGKRVGMYGGFLLACYDEESEEYQSICKIGTGFTEESLEKHYNFLKDHVLEKPRPYYRWDSSTEPNHWLAAVQVWEVKCADLSISPVHKAAIGLVDEEKGISLRFPRFLRVRDDKKPEEATTSSQVAELYRQQQQIQNQQPAEKAEEEDFY
uniref:DNA ligase n=1 Tax=Chrysemys picta bellii TaxID=8478 RepID=A0A8C3FGW5_CHRPI